MSLYTAALDAGAVVGTPLCGAIAHVAGYRLMFATTALASLAGLALVRLDALFERGHAPGRARIVCRDARQPSRLLMAQAP